MYVQQHSRESLSELPFNFEMVENNVKSPLLSVASKFDHALLAPPHVDVENQYFTNQKNCSVKKEAEKEKDVKQHNFIILHNMYQRHKLHQI